VVYYRSDASFLLYTRGKDGGREKKKKEKEICPSQLLCTIAMHAFGVYIYICLLSLYKEHID